MYTQGDKRTIWHGSHQEPGIRWKSKIDPYTLDPASSKCCTVLSPYAAVRDDRKASEADTLNTLIAMLGGRGS